MQATLARRRIEYRLLFIGALWLCAAIVEYAFMRQPGNAFLPATMQLRLSAIPIQQIASEFPILAQTIAASVLGVWLLKCSRDGGFLICSVCAGSELLYEFGQRSDVSSWVIPMLPHGWAMDNLPQYLGKGTFSPDHVAAIILGGLFSYLVVMNTIPSKR